ncbi:MAG: tRNA (adenosine(37)-N6)-threonylcarbamoyltransferase complex ATPase subunit type 1 TsaE [Terrimicrobiaceae bacterium]
MANRNRLLDKLQTDAGVVCSSVDDTMQLGTEIAAELGDGSVVSLEGPLGAGKTQLTKGIVRALGFSGEVSSPSFALLHEYEGGRMAVHHFDFYRMEVAGELTTVGYDDCLAEGITIVEWGDKFPEVLPAGTLRIRLEVLPDGGRRIRGERTL